MEGQFFMEVCLKMGLEKGHAGIIITINVAQIMWRYDSIIYIFFFQTTGVVFYDYTDAVDCGFKDVRKLTDLETHAIPPI